MRPYGHYCYRPPHVMNSDNPNKEVVLRRKSHSAANIIGLLAHKAQAPLTVEEMDEAVRQRVKSRRS